MQLSNSQRTVRPATRLPRKPPAQSPRRTRKRANSLANASQAAIAANGLGKKFGSVHAVDRLSFDVREGEIFGLVGPDGAGKTTTLRMLSGVMPPDDGSATVAGIDVVHDPEKAKNFLSYMPQRFGLYE